MSSREILLYYSLKYNGDWSKIYNAIHDKEEINYEEAEQTIKEFKGKYITILDEEYPQTLKRGYKAPFVLFYEGNINLLNDLNYQKLTLNEKHKTTETEKKVAVKILHPLRKDIALILGAENDLNSCIVNTHSNPIIMILSNSLDSYKDIELKDKILKNKGVFITEYPKNLSKEEKSGIKPITIRIFAGLCDKAMFITNVKEHSSSTILAFLTIQVSKDLLIVPNSPLEEGYVNNQLISEGAYCIYNSNVLNQMFDR